MWVPFLPGNALSLRSVLLACPCVPRTSRWRLPRVPLFIVVLAALPWPAVPWRAHAQQVVQPQIRVEARIVARARSQVALLIQIGPAEALPKKGFISLRGLPPNVTLTAGQSIAAGSWTVPIAELATLKADIPAGLSGQASVLISLIALNGRMLAQARTTLVVEPSTTPSASAEGARTEGAPPERAAPGVPAPTPPPQAAKEETKTPAAPSPAPAARPAELSAAEKERAEHALAQGGQYLARGSVLVARQYFQLAAEAGLAEAALRLAATYDPTELQRLEVSGVVPDRDMARKWYERARDLGSRDAEALLARLSGR
jgi:hypothetical protein